VALTVIPTTLPGVLILEPSLHGDARGHFTETYNSRDFARETGVAPVFVQDNQSRSARGVLRGMHYQVVKPQGKLVRVVRGTIYDVVVDVRRSAPTYGQWEGVELSEENRRQLWVPAGFGHGFLVTSESADVAYKVTDFWYPEHDRGFRWDDPAIGIRWPLDGPPTLAAKDAAAPPLSATEGL
jgi:dTDP-4-dehydrorhamnose 3,5-epimerase